MPKDEKQKQDACEASARYRDKQKEEGIPTGAQITRQIAVASVKLLAAGHKLEKSDIGLIVSKACQLAGWDATNTKLVAVIKRRIDTMLRTPRVEAYHSEQKGQE